MKAYYSGLGRLRMLAGHAALDLANTTHWRDGRIIDFIPDYGALRGWSVPAGILTPEESEVLAGLEKGPEAVSVHHRWLEMRRLFRGHLEELTAAPESPPPPNGLALALAEVVGPIALQDVAGSFGGPAVQISANLPLARSFCAIMNLMLFTEPASIRQCEGQPCGGFFLNTSRSKPRRWCAMDACGNRAKVHRHREAHGAAEGHHH
ncbi:MAG: CGNR zinc finger domain-containing protein [Alphaproteobacteria bacterium]|nr:CGNR zinc finger domain-containing protein [Alphaproteobacteria bacterium]